MTRLDLQPTSVVPGGAALARDDEGRVVFVEGAIPGERVVAEVVEERKDFRRARVLDVVDASPARVAPPCGNVALGCGGCGWQHIAIDAQRTLKESMVVDALTRITKVPAHALPPIRTVGLAERAFRTTVRVAVDAGRAHYRHAASHELVAANDCHVAHPLVAQLLDEGDFGSATEAVVRVGVDSGERAVLLTPNVDDARLPDDVVIGGAIHERIGDRVLRASIRSFFQASPQAAAALVDAVVSAVDDMTDGSPGRVADLYAGVGLFAGAIGSRFAAEVVAVERDRSSVGDARENLRDLDASIVRAEVGAWRPASTFDVVVADPARPGLGKPGVSAVVAAGAPTVVLVSCDAASLARDAALLGAHGFRIERMALVDAFPHTPHVEVVSVFQS